MHWFMHDAPRGEFRQSIAEVGAPEKNLPFEPDHFTGFGRTDCLLAETSCNEINGDGRSSPISVMLPRGFRYDF
jgi:hypothetical protein